MPAVGINGDKLQEQINTALSAKFSPGHAATYVRLDYPLAWLDEEAFGAVHVKEHDAETAVGEALKQAGLLGYYTKSQLAEGNVPSNDSGRKYLNSYTPRAGWFVLGVPEIYNVGSTKGTIMLRPTPTTRTCRWPSTVSPFNRVSIARKANQLIWSPP